VALLGEAIIPLAPQAAWTDTFLTLPNAGASNVLTGKSLEEHQVAISTLFADLPVALLRL
jgi:maltooligosyltrehalose synthase